MADGFLGLFSDRVWDVLVAAPTAALAFALIFRWSQIMERWNERRRIRAEETAADWSRLRDENTRLSAYAERLEAKLADRDKDLEQTEDGRLHWMERAIRAEAFLHGEGFVREAAAQAAAEVRRDAREETK